jgi:hypothetical protein
LGAPGIGFVNRGVCPAAACGEDGATKVVGACVAIVAGGITDCGRGGCATGIIPAECSAQSASSASISAGTPASAATFITGAGA